MKKFMFLIAALMVMAGASNAFAESHGSTIVPMMKSFYGADKTYVYTTLYISNITDEEISCTVKYFDHDGNDIGDQARIFNGRSDTYSFAQVSSGSTFTLPANSSRHVIFYGSKTHRIVLGYGIIEWQSNNEKMSKALVGGIHYVERNGAHEYSSGYVQINNGQPF